MSTIETHLNQPNATDIPPTKIVSAYGLRKCPKLVEQVCSEDVNVRVNALAVLCDEFTNPYSIQGCMQAGVAVVLAKMISDPDYLTRERATRALAIAAKDANGVSSILENHVVLVEVLNGIKDPSETVRCNVYDCLMAISDTQKGRESAVIAGIVFNFVDALTRDEDYLRCKILKTLVNIVMVPQGLDEALGSHAVKICIDIMKSANVDLAEQAARTLGVLCFSETAKSEALELQAVPALIVLLKNTQLPKTMKVAIVIALMSITSTTTGRIQMHSPEAISRLSAIMQEDDDRTLRLSLLKLITNITVFPPIRQLLLDDAPLLKFIERFKSTEEQPSADPLLEKHALIALEAVYWKP